MNLPSIFGTETVDTILANFNAQRDKLRAISDKLQEAAKREQSEAEQLRLAAEAKNKEADRAIRVAQKIAELVG
jgi:alkylation response protein AidB-like acyl-CoA dehydrogenase